MTTKTSTTAIGLAVVAACAAALTGCASTADASTQGADRLAVTTTAEGVTVGVDDASVTYVPGAQDYADRGEWVGRVEALGDGGLRISTPVSSRTVHVAASFPEERVGELMALDAPERAALDRMTRVMIVLGASGDHIVRALSDERRATTAPADGVRPRAIVDQCSWVQAWSQCQDSGYTSARCQGAIDQLIAGGC